MSGIKSVSSAADTHQKTPLYSLSINAHGEPVIEQNVHSKFATTDGESIQQIRKRAYAKNAGGRYSRVQTITAHDATATKYTIKHLIHHYSPALALDEVKHL